MGDSRNAGPLHTRLTGRESTVASMTAAAFLALTQDPRTVETRAASNGRPLPLARTAEGQYRSLLPPGRRGLSPLHLRAACRDAAERLYPDHRPRRSAWVPADPPRRPRHDLAAFHPGRHLPRQ